MAWAWRAGPGIGSNQAHAPGASVGRAWRAEQSTRPRPGAASGGEKARPGFSASVQVLSTSGVEIAVLSGLTGRQSSVGRRWEREVPDWTSGGFCPAAGGPHVN